MCVLKTHLVIKKLKKPFTFKTDSCWKEQKKTIHPLRKSQLFALWQILMVFVLQPGKKFSKQCKAEEEKATYSALLPSGFSLLKPVKIKSRKWVSGRTWLDFCQPGLHHMMFLSMLENGQEENDWCLLDVRIGAWHVVGGQLIYHPVEMFIRPRLFGLWDVRYGH